MLDRVLRHRLVCGVRDETIRKLLLSDIALDLDRALQIAKGLESAQWPIIAAQSPCLLNRLFMPHYHDQYFFLCLEVCLIWLHQLHWTLSESHNANAEIEGTPSHVHSRKKLRSTLTITSNERKSGSSKRTFESLKHTREKTKKEIQLMIFYNELALTSSLRRRSTIGTRLLFVIF